MKQRNEKGMKSNVLVPAYWAHKLRTECILYGIGEDDFFGQTGLEEDPVLASRIRTLRFSPGIQTLVGFCTQPVSKASGNPFTRE